MKQKRLGEQIAERLALRISEGEYAIASRLPSERELAERFAVGRPAVREALLVLERDGLVEIKTGSGVYVTSQQPKRARALEADISMLELIESRCLFEGEAAALAAKLATPAQLADIAAALAAMEEEDRFDVPGEKADREFHVRIARATQNAAIVYVVETLWDARVGSSQVAHTLEQVRAAGIRPRIDEHRAVFDAIVAADADGARAAMRAHLMRVIDDLIKAAESKEIAAMQARIDEQRKRYLGDLTKQQQLASGRGAAISSRDHSQSQLNPPANQMRSSSASGLAQKPPNPRPKNAATEPTHASIQPP
ncbi:FadR family transcriptional regulator [bacterium]|nr:FadR family transcriptional regulator [bacterium]